jgi:hypothetical protein
LLNIILPYLTKYEIIAAFYYLTHINNMHFFYSFITMKWKKSTLTLTSFIALPFTKYEIIAAFYYLTHINNMHFYHNDKEKVEIQRV